LLLEKEVVLNYYHRNAMYTVVTNKSWKNFDQTDIQVLPQ